VTFEKDWCDAGVDVKVVHAAIAVLAFGSLSPQSVVVEKLFSSPAGS